MFGLTSQPQRTTNGRVTANTKEEIRHGSSSSTYDTAAAERMKMEYLRKERERREKERNKLLYEERKREYDRLVDEEARMRTESRRLEAEVVKYTYDVEGAKRQDTKEKNELTVAKKQEAELTQKIQKIEAELLSYKNQRQKIQQDIARIEQTDKNLTADLSKRTSYATNLKGKFEAITRKHEETSKQIAKLKSEVEQLHRLIM